MHYLLTTEEKMMQNDNDIRHCTRQWPDERKSGVQPEDAHYERLKAALSPDLTYEEYQREIARLVRECGV